MAHLPLHSSTRRVLEFDAVLELLAGYAQTPMGGERLRGRSPSADPDWIAESQQAVRQMVESAAVRGFAALGSAQPVDSILASVATQGVVLEVEQLLEVARLARVTSELRRHLVAGASERWPALEAYGKRLPALGRLREQIERLVSPEGEFRDDASPELQRARQKRHALHAHVRERMERLTRDERVRHVLQDSLVTTRGGRFVVPVRADHREGLKGIVHDSSASRQTIYVEPFEFVEDQNRLAELAARERAEIVRLLSEASAHVGAARESLERAQQTIARVDELQALARYAQHVDAASAEPIAAGLRLRQATHPLIERERFVPLDLELDPETRALIITGPNTGGKTVALKTIGLLALMNQSGIPVPAAEARLPVFSRLYADIGDEQSLSANLSTFSAHMGHIIEFLSDCPPGSLVLLDELGTGTDPEEGAALGITLVERFLQRGALVVVSTHHDAMKSFAHSHEGAMNAAMEFDPDTLAPTYRIRVGRPGRSNALDIARGLGLEPALIDRARSLLRTESVHLDEIIRRLERESRETTEQREQLGQRELELEETTRRYEAAEQRRRAAWKRLEGDARAAIEEAVGRLRREGAEKLSELETVATNDSERTRADRRARWGAVAGGLEGKSMRRLRDRLERQHRSRETVAPGPTPSAASKPDGRDQPDGAERAALRRGDRVCVVPFGLSGTMMHDWAPDDDASAIEVDVGGKRLVVRREQLQAAAGDRPGRSRGAKGGGTRYSRRHDVKSEIDLHGMIVEDALVVLDKYLDDALLAELSSVRIIHGYGRLRLRDAIHAWLGKRPGVTKFAAAGPGHGGAGVTIVKFGD